MRFIGIVLTILYCAITSTRAIPVPASKLNSYSRLQAMIDKVSVEEWRWDDPVSESRPAAIGVDEAGRAF